MLPKPLFLNVHMYGIMIAVGLLCCFVMIFFLGKKMKLEEKFVDFIFYNGIASIVIGFLAASLFQAFYDFIENPAGGFNFGQKMTFMGGLIGGVVTFLIIYFIVHKKFKNTLFDALPMVPSCILVAHGFGRVGCFFAGCCFGKPTDSIFGVKFAAGSVAAAQYPALDGGSVALHPTQLYEAFFLFILCAVCTLLVLKKGFKHTMSVYLIGYGVFRFLIEYLRADDRGAFFGPFSPSQLLSFFMVAGGVGLIFLVNWYYARKAKKAESAEVEQ